MHTISPLVLKVGFLILLGAVGYWGLVTVHKKKFFPLFFIALIIVAPFLLAPEPQPETPLPSEEQKAQIRLEQNAFAPWYAAYRKDIDHASGNWKQYHRIVQAFQNDEISVQTAYLRLADLRKETAAIRSKMESAKPPAQLTGENATLTDSIIEKTAQFVRDQDEAVAKTAQAIAPENLKTADHTAQVRLLEKVVVLNTPANLDISSEILSIKDNLIVPGEG